MAEAWVQRMGGERAQRARDEWSDRLPIMLRSVVSGPMSVGRFRQPFARRLVLIKWVLAGRASMGVRGRQVPFGPGDMAVHLPTQPHAFWCDVAGTEMCWFSVDGALAEQFAFGLGLRAGVYHFGEAPRKHLTEMLRSLSDQTIDGCRRSSRLAVDALYDIAGRLPRKEAASVVQLVRHQVREGLSDPQLSAKRLADKLHYSRGALSRAFRRESGVTIMDYITRIRLEEAEMLLTNTDERIGDVARKCGFVDHSYFTRWIRKHTGRLPGELREASGELPSHRV